MKNILFLLLLIPVISFSQYSKKELKKLKKLELKIVNRGLDLDATFVPYFKKKYFTRENGTEGVWGANTEDRWAEAMFTYGIDVGDYSRESQVKDANNREMNLSNSLIFNGRYVFDCNTNRVIKIQDLQNNNKIVATIKYEGRSLWLGYGKNLSLQMEYIIQELIKSNK
tara:strand:+ start:111 stop:617 length:507 start_codon:yes stop_codon:yes gene_type:complete